MKKEIKNVSDEEINISFCLPVYNVGKYIQDCVDSIISQCSGLFLYEIICIDDFSSDNSYEVLAGIQKRVPQIKIFRNDQNKGVSYTRNRAITLAEGKYIWFVDPDDMLFPGAVIKMLTEIENKDGNVVLGNYVTGSENIKYEDFAKNQGGVFKELLVEDEEFLPQSQAGKKMCTVCAGMFKRKFLMENDLRFQEKMIAQEDTLFYYQFSLRVNDIIKYENPCYIYRQRDSSVMHSKSEERSRRYYTSMRVMYDVYNTHLLKGDYKSKERLLKKIHHTRENIATTLAGVPNTSFVRSEMRELRKKGIYPYPFRKQSLRSNGNLLKRILFFLQPIEMFFWVLHILYKIYFQKTKRNLNGS